MSKKKIKILISEFYRKNKARFVLTMLVGIIADILSLFVSQLIKNILDFVTEESRMQDFVIIILETIVVLSMAFLFDTLFAFFKNRYVACAMKNYKNKLFERLTQKDLSSFRGENSATYLSSLTNDAAAIESGYVEAQFEFVTQIVYFVGSIALMLYNSPLLTLVAVIMALLPMAVSMLTGNKLAVYEKNVSQCNAGFMAMVQDALKGFTVVKCFQAEKEIEQIVDDSNEKLEESKRKRNIVKSMVSLIGNISGAGIQFGLFLVGAYLAMTGHDITAGTLLLFVQVMNYMLGPIRVLPGLLANRKASRVLIEKAVNFHENTKEAGHQFSAKIGDIHKISLEHVTFGYEEGKTVLKDISVDFERGKSYALVGASGCGKSTLLNLLMSSYEGYSGKICYDKQELRTISAESLYGAVSMIEQSVFVFNASIRDNITMFHSFPKDEVEKAIALSGLKDMIQKKGDDYLCGENGSNLSGGEKQRISIARSLLRRNQVLLVDEATAALDAETSYHVTNAILDLNGLTRIVVTHDLEETCLRRYDEIIALKDGKIIEKGSFEELMKQGKYFYSLYTIAH